MIRATKRRVTTVDTTPAEAMTDGAVIAGLTEIFGSGDMVRAAALSIDYRCPDAPPKLGGEITPPESSQE